MVKIPAWKRMSSGRYLDLNNLKPEDLDIGDINTSLNHIFRFNGHYSEYKPLTVAQHSLLCLKLAEKAEPEDYKLHLYTFIHDFAEAYIGDVSSPVKWALGNAWYDFARPIEATVEKHFAGELAEEDIHNLVKIFDLASLDLERRVMWRSQYGKDKWPEGTIHTGNLKEKVHLFQLISDHDVDVESVWRRLLKKVGEDT